MVGRFYGLDEHPIPSIYIYNSFLEYSQIWDNDARAEISAHFPPCIATMKNKNHYTISNRHWVADTTH